MATTPLAGLEDLFAIERKTVADLVGCCTGDNRGPVQARAAPFARLPGLSLLVRDYVGSVLVGLANVLINRVAPNSRPELGGLDLTVKSGGGVKPVFD